MLGLAFARPELALLAWVALVPLLWALRGCGPIRGGVLGFVAGGVFFGILLYWTAIFGAIALIGMVGYTALCVAIFAAGASWLLRHPSIGWRMAAIPALWVVLEWVRSAGSWGFSWGVLGYSQQSVLPVAQFVSLAGVLGLSGALVLVNASLVEVALAARGERRRALGGAVVAVTVVAGVLGWGLWRASVPVAPARLKVAGVQPSIDQWAKFDVAQADSIMRILGRLTKRALRTEPALLIWPETAIPFEKSEDSFFVQRARMRAASAGADFLFGSFETAAGGRITNSALLTTPLGTTTRYDKVHLVPFGEYVPLRALIGNIGMLRMVNADQKAAEAPTVLTSSWGPIGTVICFESSDEALVRRVVNLGAQLVVVITNDGWFYRTAVADQHFRITAMRAIENGTYVVQVSNNGISGIIDPRGRVLTRTRLWGRTVMRGRVGLGAESTPYRAVGSLPVLVVSLAILATAVATARPTLFHLRCADDKLPDGIR